MEWRPFQYLSLDQFERLSFEDKCAYLRVALVHLTRTRALLRMEAGRVFFAPDPGITQH